MELQKTEFEKILENFNWNFPSGKNLQCHCGKEIMRSTVLQFSYCYCPKCKDDCIEHNIMSGYIAEGKYTDELSKLLA